MSKLRYKLYVTLIIVLITFILFNANYKKSETQEHSPITFDTSKTLFLNNIWNQKCKNGGIYFPDHCRCPPKVSGERCEIGTTFLSSPFTLDNCTPEVDWSPTTSKQNGTDVVCQFTPAIFHCYREEINKRDQIRVHRLSGKNIHIIRSF